MDMNLERHDYITAGISFFLAAVTLYGWTHLPEQIAIHFDSSGQPDSTAGKLPGLLLIPAISAGLYVLFRYLPEIDPLGDNIEEFRPEYNLVMVSVLGLLTYVQALIVSWNLGFSFSMSQALVPAVAALYYIVGEVVGEAEQNWFIGIRTPWTLSSEEVWNKTHEKSEPLFKAAGLTALLGVVFPEYTIAFIAGPAAAIAVFSTVYSYVAYRKTEP
jgi:uncharacterized membrane protein